MSGTPRDNPYLAHLPPSQRGVGPSGSNTIVKDPLYGFLPRHVKGDQVRKVLVCVHIFNDDGISYIHKEGDVNPFTKQSHSTQYKKILEARKKLPVYAQMNEFLKMVCIRGVLRLEEGFELYYL